ncbi:MAG: ABC transporter ATP-binding protein [Ruminiclostridium sp.]
MIVTEGITKLYKSGEREFAALRDVSIRIERGEFVAITGASGSGKTTLMNILGCLDRASSGSYFLDGENVADLSGKRRTRLRNEKIAFIFQSFNLLNGLNALENAALPLIYRGLSRSRAHERAEAALDMVGLTMRALHKPNQLSGGQQQRVAIARAIASDTPVILADEPCGSLDSRSGSRIMELLKSENEKGKTIILITHDLKAAGKADRLITVRDGRVFT